jgi:hypothetical protein
MSSLLKPGRLSVSTERIVVALTLIVYAGLLIYLIPRHEPWADEAQAWELAKSLGLKSLFGTYIHYECSPGLWHLVLWLLARLNVTYSGMHWFTGAIAVLSMAILMIASPFPLPLRILLPFTYFFAFQYAVVARSYVLFTAILFALAWVWPTRLKHPITLAILTGLLANVALHGLVTAIGLGIVLAVEWYSIQNLEQGRWRRWLVAAALFSVMLGFALWCVAPAPDAGWLWLAKQMPSSISMSGIANHPSIHTLPNSLVVAISTLLRFVHVLSYGLTDRFHLGVIAWALLLWRLRRQGRLRYSLPVIFLAITCMYSLFSYYHAGLFWVLFLFLWWVTWPEDKAMRGKEHWMATALLVVVLLCIAAQLVWAANAIRYDVAMPYSSSRDGAVILQKYLKRGDKVDVAVASAAYAWGGQSYITGIEPYFMLEPIHNKIHRFWFWGGDDDLRAKYLDDSEHHAVVVIVEEMDDDQGSHAEEKRLKALGYQRAETVCGRAYYPDDSGPRVCDAFFQPSRRQGGNP